MQIEIAVCEDPTPEDRAAILATLNAHNVSQVGAFEAKSVVLLLRESVGGQVVGGLWARTGYDWLFVELLAVPNALRGQGVGSDLMRRAEAIARERGCVGVRLDTYSFQAPTFYEKLGYETFGTLDDHPRGAKRHFMRKYLDER